MSTIIMVACMIVLFSIVLKTDANAKRSKQTNDTWLASHTDETLIIEGKFNGNALFYVLGGLGFLLVMLFNPLRNLGEKLDQGIFEQMAIYCIFLGLALMIYALLFIFATVSNSLYITNKRIYGKAIFGRRVDLPVDSISAVGSGLFKGITITSASGRISYLCLANRDEIHCAVSDLLANRNTTMTHSILPQIEKDEAEELRKYKKLLDDGIITQEEFEAKKKQLLGL